MRNRKSINLKKIRNHEANQSSKKRLKKILSDQFAYQLTKNAFNRKKYRWSYYFSEAVDVLFKLSIEVMVFLAGLQLVATVLAMLDFIINSKFPWLWEGWNYFASAWIAIVFIFMLIKPLNDFLKGIWIEHCNQLLAILKHDGEMYWNNLSKDEQRILHKYVAEQSIKIQKKKLKNMRYGDFITTKDNLEYLQSIECLSFMPEIHISTFDIKSFGNYSLGVLEDKRRNSRGVKN